MKRAGWFAALLLLASLAGCRRAPEGAAGGGSGAAAAELVAQGHYDQAIELLGDAGDAESLCLLGRAWAGKAAAAPRPVPAAPAGGSVVDPAPFKPEELKALDYLERAVAARPDLAAAHLALGELLAPHALARLAVSRGRDAVPFAGPDAGVERVVQALGQALQADPAGQSAGEALVRFAASAGRLNEADAAYRELLNRRRGDPDLLVRYGDFLAGPRQDGQAALERYAQALIWRPEDPATRAKIAEIHLRAAAEHLQRQEYTSAERRLAEAKRSGIDAGSTQAARLRELQDWVRDVRGR